MAAIKIVGLSGGLSRPSRTLALVERTTARIADVVSGAAGKVETRIVDVAALAGIGALRSREGAGIEEEAAFRAVETADLLVAGSPVYKGSYSGLFKHFIDLVDYRGLDGVPVALVATGGSDRHALVIEHQLRPLFAFFQAQPLGTGVFFTEREFADGRVAEGAPSRRFERMVAEAAHALEARRRAARALPEAAA